MKKSKRKKNTRTKVLLKVILCILLIIAAILLIINIVCPLIWVAIGWFCEHIIAPAIVILAIIAAICVWAAG